MLSMIKMIVAPVSAIALIVAMVSMFKYCSMGLPNMARAVSTIKGSSRTFVLLIFLRGEWLDVMMGASSSLWTTLLLAVLFKVGSKEIILAETK